MGKDGHIPRPAVIDKMHYTACPVCGEAGMKRLPGKWWYCPKCRNKSMTTIPSREQIDQGKRTFAPWMETE